MADLIAFLRARLDEDWKLAYESGCGGRDDWAFDPEDPWNGPNGPREVVRRATGGFIAVVDPDHGKYGTWNARHIARHNPARVLAEVDAKRRILDEVVPEMDGMTDQIHSEWGVGPIDPSTYESLVLLRLLALPYASHPDYRDEWRS
ncbi:DUF6221 family protein [Streptomyces sp. NBC_00250]|uniref:DUF6221 family protein n=1 Tax=Streptomyces sp. NBC_00250 TaxID=2903641 RepID=UPI002E2DC524|nr:DUF6221 family protein [Streptomyces sp. NBC_00250]